MSDFQSPGLPERNPLTHRAHRREVFWQITLPLAIGVIIFVALIVLISLSGSGEVSRWSDISLMWLIIPVLLVFLIFLAILGGLAYGVIYLVRILPGYARQLQDLVALVGEKVKSASDTAVEPVLRIQGFIASLRVLRRK